MRLDLNEPQRRHLAVVLDHVDAALLEVVSGASGDAARSADRLLRPLNHDIPAPAARQLLEAAVGTRSRLQADMADLGLRSSPESLRRRLTAYLTSALVLLEDCHSHAMVAYGDVNPDLPRQLDPWLKSLEDAVSTMRRFLDGWSDHGTPA